MANGSGNEASNKTLRTAHEGVSRSYPKIRRFPTESDSYESYKLFVL